MTRRTRRRSEPNVRRVSTVTFNLTGRNGPGFTNFHATDTIISASGNLAGLHGVLNWESVTLGANGPLGAYSGQILFGT